MTDAAGGDGGTDGLRLESSRLRLEFDPSTLTFRVEDPVGGGLLLTSAGVAADVARPIAGAVVATVFPASPFLPPGSPGLQLKLAGEDGVDLLWEAALVGERLMLRLGLHNRSARPVRLKQAFPCRGACVLPGRVGEGTRILTLDGLAGAGNNRVEPGPRRESPNNLLLLLPDLNRCLVAGGATYRDFAKYLSTAPDGQTGGVQVTLEQRDPVGRLVRPDERYLPDDWFYLDLLAACPFEALEHYGRWVRDINRAAPCPYTFPTVCGWYASMPGYGGGEWINHTTGLVDELEAARQKGFLRYSRVGVRLVPDTYDGTSSRHRDPREAGLDPRLWSADRNTEQGWWDDEHWRRFGHYTEPHETSAKWAAAVRARGGVPITYVQTGHVSHDYAREHPGHMLRNDISELDRIFIGHHPYVTYDYTDPGFRAHLRGVWGNLGRAGVQGVFFDYPDQAWIEAGGFEDPQATTASAYRGVFDLVKPALGPETYIQERNVARRVPYLDLTVGLVDSQRVWGDTDGVAVEMFRMCALRWYKTRTLYSYDTDAKNLLKIADRGRDALRQVLTMLYLTTGRILLANSFRVLPPEVVHDLSRLFPAHAEPLTPRPLDAFTGAEVPRIFDLALGSDWHQLTLFNPDPGAPRVVEVSLAGRAVDGSPGLDPAATYHGWDFWNDRAVGPVAGSVRLREELRPGEARMISLRRRLSHPQVVSTDRHLLQGWVELSDVSWDAAGRVLSGRLESVAGEETVITLACNGARAGGVAVEGGQGRVLERGDFDEDFVRVGILSHQGGGVRWRVGFM